MLNEPRYAAYLEAATSGATELELLLVVYDALTNALCLAAKAVDRGDIAQRCAQTNRVLLLLGHLESWAAEGQDPDLKASLTGWYQYLRERVLGLQNGGERNDFEGLAAVVSDVRRTWKAKEEMLRSERFVTTTVTGPLQVRATA